MKTTRPKDYWTERDDAYLRRNWGWLPLRQIAENLGRTESAVTIRVKRKLKLMCVSDWPEILTDGELAQAMGVDRKTIWDWLNQGKVPVMRLWRSNTPTLVVDRSELKAWLANPDNWYMLDLDKIQDQELLDVVRRTKRRWDDEWLSIGQAAQAINVVNSTLNKHCNGGRLAGRQNGNWFIKRSDLLRFAREAYGFNG